MRQDSVIIDSFSGDYRFLSNFYPAPVQGVDILENFEYPTVEHAFQATKSMDRADREAICRCRTPAEAKRLGRRIKLRADWEDVKLNVMRHLLEDKFHVSKVLAYDLDQTGDAQLVEGNDWGDIYWGLVRGENGDWEGDNWLGFMLMAIRATNRPAIRNRKKK